MRTTIDPLGRQVRAFCAKHDMLPQGGTVLCAVSGGRDSMALLHLSGPSFHGKKLLFIPDRNVALLSFYKNIIFCHDILPGHFA